MTILYPIDSRRCFTCTFRRNDYRHLRACVPKRYWPVPDAEETPPAVDNRMIYLEEDDEDEVDRLVAAIEAAVDAPSLACDVCGKVVAHGGALAGHKRSHREQP